MVCSLAVVGSLLHHRAGEVKIVPSCIVEDSDECISKLDFFRLAMRQMVIHLVFADALKGLADFAVDQGEHLSLVAPKATLGLWIIPPAPILQMNIPS